MIAGTLLLLSISHGGHGWILLPETIRGPTGLSTSSDAPFHLSSTTFLSLTPDDDANQNDGGWGAPPSLEDKAKELRQLQNARNVESSNYRSSPPRQTPEIDRDFFIPIFSIVSLAGLFGSYGYEMLRLYSRGELYLPWDN